MPLAFKVPSPFVTRDMFSSSFNRGCDYNIHSYNQAIRIKTLCVLLSCCLLFFDCLPINKNFPLIFAQNNTYTQGIAAIDSKSRVHLHVTSKRFMGANRRNEKDCKMRDAKDSSWDTSTATRIPKLHRQVANRQDFRTASYINYAYNFLTDSFFS